jgi:DNA-binding CsgD family transcriptional regulator
LVLYDAICHALAAGRQPILAIDRLEHCDQLSLNAVVVAANHLAIPTSVLIAVAALDPDSVEARNFIAEIHPGRMAHVERGYVESGQPGLVGASAPARGSGNSVEPGQPGWLRSSDCGWQVGLTRTEEVVVDALLDGLTNREMAARLHVSIKTVEFHLANAYRKFGVRTRLQLARKIEDVRH